MHEDKVSALKRLVSFLRTVPRRQRAWIKSVEVYSGIITDGRKYFPTWSMAIDDTRRTLFRLADACRNNRHINVKYRLKKWGQEVCGDSEGVTIGAGLQYLAVLRNQNLSDVLPRNARGCVRPLSDLYFMKIKE
jgi:hypothetical protein